LHESSSFFAAAASTLIAHVCLSLILLKACSFAVALLHVLTDLLVLTNCRL
jgi:hypothetical protein